MIARGFKPVGWVAAVGGAALCCYMLSLKVATERNDLARVEAQIIATKQAIRSLQTELGTRGRLQQLERWNADVLALSAPAADQFMQNEYTLARFDQQQPGLVDSAPVRLASAEVDQTGSPAVRAAVASQPAPRKAEAEEKEQGEAAPAKQPSLVHRASLQTEPEPAAEKKPAPTEPKRSKLGDDKLIAEIGAAASAEKKSRSGARQ